MPPRTARRKKIVTPSSEEDEQVEVPTTVVDNDEEEEVVVVEKKKKKSSSTKKNKKRKKKQDDSDDSEEEEIKPTTSKRKKKASASSSTANDDQIPINDDGASIEQQHDDTTFVDAPIVEEEAEIVEELSLDSIKSDHEFVMQSVGHIRQSIDFLDSIERNYATLPSSERQTTRLLLKHLQNRVGKLFDLCKSAELLLFRGANHDMSEYGLLNTIQLPEIWATVFSYLNFTDFLSASQVCKIWQAASLQAHALSCFHVPIEYSGGLTNITQSLEIFKKYIAWRLENIHLVSGVPSKLLLWLAGNNIVFPNAKYENVYYRIQWEETPTYETTDTNLTQLFPKYTKKVFQSEFDSFMSFFDVGYQGTIKVPPGTKIAKMISKNCEFEDPASIEELMILRFGKNMPQFENLQQLDISYHIKLEGVPTKYSFNSTKLKKLVIPYFCTMEEVKSLVPHFANIESLKLVDGGGGSHHTSSRSSSPTNQHVICYIANFTSLKELEIDTLTESELTKVPPTLHRLKIGKVVEKSSKIVPLLSNIEELHTTEQILSHIDLIRLPKLKTLLVYNNTSNHNKQITIESTTIENISLLTYNSIIIKCPNLYDLRIGPGLKGGSDSIYIKSNQLTNFVLEREVQMLSIQGPNFVSDGSILERVKNIVDLECPLISKAYVNSISSINQGDSFRTLLTKQIKTLTISVAYFDLFATRTEIQNLHIHNWKTSQRISPAKLNVYRQNANSFKTLKITYCSVEVIKILNSIFKDSESLESLTIEDTNFDSEYIDTISNPVHYPNLRALSLGNIVSFKPQVGFQFLKSCDKRPLLKKIGLHYKSSYKKRYPTYIPIHCTHYSGQLSGCSNHDPLPNLISCTVSSGGMPNIDYAAFKLFPNLKTVSFENVLYFDPLTGSEVILEYCKELETVVASSILPKQFKEHKNISVLDHSVLSL